MKRYNRITSMSVLGALFATAALNAGCGGTDQVKGVTICITITALPAENLDGVTANFNLIWTSHDVIMDSANYTPPSGVIHGNRACFTGSVGYGVDTSDFSLKSISVSLVDSNGVALSGPAVVGTPSYNSTTKIDTLDTTATVTPTVTTDPGTGGSGGSGGSDAGGPVAILEHLNGHYKASYGSDYDRRGTQRADQTGSKASDAAYDARSARI